MSKQKNFLGSRSFAPGEYESQQATFDGAIDALSRTLMEPVGRSLRLQLAQHGIDAFEEARMTLDAMITDSFSDEVKDAAEAAEAQRVQEAVMALDDDDIAQEVRTCSREIAERVLARWLERLNHALRTADSVRLNANLLPGNSSVDQMLEHINFEADGINRLVVVNGLRTYWDDLTRASLAKEAPIELGRHVWIVPLHDDQTYQLFKERPEAEECMRASSRKTEPAVSSRADGARFLDLYNYLLAILSPAAPRLEKLAVSLYRTRALHGRRNAPSALVQWSDAAIAKALFGEGKEPEHDLMSCVEAGVDYVAAGLQDNDEWARSVLGAPSKISQHLKDYAEARKVSIFAVHNAFALAVSVGAECQPMRYDGDDDLIIEKQDKLEAYRRFADATNTNPRVAQRLVSAAFAGTAFSTPGVALP